MTPTQLKSFATGFRLALSHIPEAMTTEVRTLLDAVDRLDEPRPFFGVDLSRPPVVRDYRIGEYDVDAITRPKTDWGEMPEQWPRAVDGGRALELRGKLLEQIHEAHTEGRDAVLMDGDRYVATIEAPVDAYLGGGTEFEDEDCPMMGSPIKRDSNGVSQYAMDPDWLGELTDPSVQKCKPND